VTYGITRKDLDDLFEQGEHLNPDAPRLFIHPRHIKIVRAIEMARDGKRVAIVAPTQEMAVDACRIAREILAATDIPHTPARNKITLPKSQIQFFAKADRGYRGARVIIEVEGWL
jgi:hypothetical protein